LAVIPARWGAERFPGKALALIGGKPLVQWVWEAAQAARRVTQVVVATDQERIARVVRAFGGEAVMTSPRCPSGTDRVAQVAKRSRAGIVVNVQGDEPLLSPQSIDRVVEVLQEDPTAVMSTAVRPPASEREWRDPHAVKVVLDQMNYALYFSRSPIPSMVRSAGLPAAPRWIHIGLYAFRRAFLFRYAALPPSALEQAERLEQLRVLERGCPVKVAITSGITCAVDRPSDVKRVENMLAGRRLKERCL
jgi:3-deoxy-manno-octulosonate cytidylyltransferase (CMP-KDO synthetase)